MQLELQASVGFLELGMLEDAARELEDLSPEDRTSSDLFEIAGIYEQSCGGKIDDFSDLIACRG